MEAWKRSALSTGLIIQATRIVNEDWGTFARRKVLNEKRLSATITFIERILFSHYTLSVEYPPFSFLSFIHSHILNALFDNCIQLQVTNLSRQSLYLVERCPRWSCKNKELIEGEDPRFKSHFSSFPIVMKALSCSDICNASEGGRIYERYWWWRCFWRIKEESSSFPFILWCCDPYIIGIKHHVIS